MVRSGVFWGMGDELPSGHLARSTGPESVSGAVETSGENVRELCDIEYEVRDDKDISTEERSSTIWTRVLVGQRDNGVDRDTDPKSERFEQVRWE